MLQVDLQDRVIWLDGHIGEADGGGVDGSLMRTALARLGKGDVTIDINSPGGGVFDAQQIIDAMGNHRGTITTRSNALVASSGTTIFLAGERRILREDAAVLIHSPWSVSVGDHRRMSETAKGLLDAENRLRRFYQQRTGASDAVVAQWFDGADHWYTAEEAAELGVTTEPVASRRYRGGQAAQSAESRQRWEKLERLTLAAKYQPAIDAAKDLLERSARLASDPSAITNEAVKRSPKSLGIEWLHGETQNARDTRQRKLQALLDADFETRLQRVQKLRALGIDYPLPKRVDVSDIC
jgi:ATP-dependent protease ClpP protease subunit